MKTIGIIGAMEEELALLKSKMELVAAKNIVGTDFYVGKMCSKNVILVKCGIGKVNAAICTQVLIDMYGVDYIINTGVAGAVQSELRIGDIVISDDLVYHDFDTTAFGTPIGVIPRLSESFFKADDEMIRIAQEAGEKFSGGYKIYVGRIASGDQFVSDKEQKNLILKNFNSYCVEMEGAAVAHTCYLNKIPFVVIRAMSDAADGEAGSTYEMHKDSAAQKSGAIVEAMVEAL